MFDSTSVAVEWFAVGTLLVAIGALFTFTTPPSYLATIFAAVVLVAVVRLLYRLNTYTPDGAA